MWKRTQCPVPKLFASDCCRGENEIFSMECHTGTINPRQAPCPACGWPTQNRRQCYVCFFVSFLLFFVGEGAEGCTCCFVSFSPFFSLFRLFDFHFEWWFDYFLCIFLFDEREKKKKRKNEVGCLRNGKDLGIVGRG